MKGFQREDLLFSLCGLNCGLCPMKMDGYCPGCGGGAGNQSCKIAKCSLVHHVDYCSQCEEFPCEKYGENEYDIFITHQNQEKDLKRAEEIGISEYHREQEEKLEILKFLLQHYNDGRRKNFFCVAVNLLELDEVRRIISQIKENTEKEELTLKEKAACAAALFQEAGKAKGMELKLRKKPGKKKT